ncbi:Uncharacterised protein [Mycobacteroides abscessus subsp. abscessus]|nr:Uncharacterised protein [Mycobacteroides abscessus subsp. abscessus]
MICALLPISSRKLNACATTTYASTAPAVNSTLPAVTKLIAYLRSLA